MAHLDLKRAAASVESARQLRETLTAKTSSNGNIRFIPFLPRYSDLWLIEVLKPWRTAGRRRPEFPFELPTALHYTPREGVERILLWLGPGLGTGDQCPR